MIIPPEFASQPVTDINIYNYAIATIERQYGIAALAGSDRVKFFLADILTNYRLNECRECTKEELLDIIQEDVRDGRVGYRQMTISRLTNHFCSLNHRRWQYETLGDLFAEFSDQDPQ